MSNSELFQNERELIQQSKLVLENPNSTLEDYKSSLKILIQEYGSILSNSEKLTKISDLNQRRLLKLQEQLKESNHALEEKNQNLTLLSQVGKLVTSSLEIKDILFAIYENISKFLKVDVMMLGFFDEAQNSIKYKNILVRGEYIPSILKDSLNKENLSNSIFQTRQEFVSNHLEIDYPNFQKELISQLELPIQSVAYFPLKSHNEIIGIWALLDSNENFFQQTQIEFLKDLANFIAIGVDNANAYKKISKRNKELKGTLEEIKTLNENLEIEKEKSEHLLLNILPLSIANRLKQNEGLIADYYESATVLFADIVGFSTLSVQIGSPKDLVNMLNKIFSEFDNIAMKYGIEKIKTIGDCYMMASGVPDVCENHTEKCALAALEMLSCLKLLDPSSMYSLNFRIGIHTGNLVAGVIGTKKFVYDLWGDTVNTASRMESHGAPGRIHCSHSVYEILKEKFEFENRGWIEVKGKGNMNTYFLTGKKS